MEAKSEQLGSAIVLLPAGCGRADCGMFKRRRQPAAQIRMQAGYGGLSSWAAGQSLIFNRAPNNTEEMRMSQLKAEVMVREFHYNGIRIPDPGPDLTIDQVRDLLTPSYPEIATASVSGPEASGSVLRYTFSRAIGTKG